MLLAAQRRRLIFSMLQSEGNVSIADLARRFAVSPMTIRRDLEYLETHQLARRTHGGALLTGDMAAEWPHRFKSHAHVEEKQRLAVIAASVVRPGDTVLLDAGSTTLEIARRLKEVQPLTVVTNDLVIAMELADVAGIAVLCTGGHVHRGVYCLDGPFSEWLLQQTHVDVSFIGCDAFDPALGAMTKIQTKITLKQRMIQAARRAFLVADWTKYGRRTFLTFSPLAAFHAVVTNIEVGAEAVRRLRETGLAVLLDGELANIDQPTRQEVSGAVDLG